VAGALEAQLGQRGLLLATLCEQALDPETANPRLNAVGG
jgi:hypothetical protein